MIYVHAIRIAFRFILLFMLSGQHLLLFCCSCYLDSIYFYFVVHAIWIAFTFIFIVHAIWIAFGSIFVVRAIRIAFSFILSDEVQLGRLSLRRLDPFDFRAFGSSAQGDCSWEINFLKVIEIFRRSETNSVISLMILFVLSGQHLLLFLLFVLYVYT